MTSPGATWTPDAIPGLGGRQAVVTGANSGLGLITARELARKGASVVMACRNLGKGEAALAQVRAAAPGARVELAQLDLGSLDSVRVRRGAGGGSASARQQRWHNGAAAGRDGRRLRVAARDQPSRPLRAHRPPSPLTSVAAHPGYAATNLQSAAPPILDRLVLGFLNVVVAQSAEKGALPSLYAATVPDLAGASYVGPDGLGETRGDPRLVSMSERAQDPETARRLWAVSESLTGVTYVF